MNIAPSSVCRWFTVDDVKISRIFEIAELLGYTFTPCIYPKGQNIINNKYVDFSKQLYLNENGNIKVSRIIQICEALDWDIDFKFEKKNSLSQERHPYPTLRYSFSVEKESPIKGI